MRLQVESEDSGFLFTDLLRELSLVFSPSLVAYLAEEFGRVERLVESSFDGRLSLTYLLDFQLMEAYQLMTWIGSVQMKVRLECSGQHHGRLQTLVFRHLQVRIAYLFARKDVFVDSFLLDLVPA